MRVVLNDLLLQQRRRRRRRRWRAGAGGKADGRVEGRVQWGSNKNVNEIVCIPAD